MSIQKNWLYISTMNQVSFDYKKKSKILYDLTIVKVKLNNKMYELKRQNARFEKHIDVQQAQMLNLQK